MIKKIVVLIIIFFIGYVIYDIHRMPPLEQIVNVIVEKHFKEDIDFIAEITADFCKNDGAIIKYYLQKKAKDKKINYNLDEKEIAKTWLEFCKNLHQEVIKMTPVTSSQKNIKNSLINAFNHWPYSDTYTYIEDPEARRRLNDDIEFNLTEMEECLDRFFNAFFDKNNYYFEGKMEIALADLKLDFIQMFYLKYFVIFIVKPKQFTHLAFDKIHSIAMDNKKYRESAKSGWDYLKEFEVLFMYIINNNISLNSRKSQK